MLPALRRQAELVLAGRLFDLTLVLVGGLVVAVVAPWTGSLVRIATGLELILVGLLRLALKGQMRAFWGGVVACGFAAPLLSIGSSPIFTPGPITVQSALAYGGFAAPLGLMLVVAGAVGWRLTPAQQPPDPPWVRWMDKGLHLALTLGAAGLVFAEWSPLAIGATILCSLLLTLGTAAVVALRLRFGLRGWGGVLATLGAGGAGTCAWLVLTQEGRVSMGEAALGLVPSLGFILLGLVLALRERQR